MQGDFTWQEDEESCFYLCDDFGMTGRYFWNTQYRSAGLRVSPHDKGKWLDGLGLELGYAFFRYDWGIAEFGWDSRYPSGNYLAGTYRSHQSVLGLDYEYPFHKGRLGLALRGGGKKPWRAGTPLRPL